MQVFRDLTEQDILCRKLTSSFSRSIRNARIQNRMGCLASPTLFLCWHLKRKKGFV